MELNPSYYLLIFLFSCCYGYNAKQKKEDFTGSEKKFLDKLEENLLKKFYIDPNDIRQIKNQHINIPKYVERLYEVMSESNELGKTTTNDPTKNGVATVHTYKPTGRIHYDRVVLFQLKSEALMKNNFTKAELVLGNKWPTSLFDLSIVCINGDTDITSKVVQQDEGIIADVTHCLPLNNRQPIVNAMFKIIALPLKYGRRNLISRRQIEHMNPILLTFHNFNMNLEMTSRIKRDTFQMRLNDYNVGVYRNEITLETAEQMGACRLKPWFLNLDDIGWQNWILAPKALRSNICVGGCPALFLEKYLNATNYSFLKNLFHERQKFLGKGKDRQVKIVPEATCSPVSYTQLTIMYRNTRDEIVVKSLPEMRVLSCGCR